MAKRGIGVLFTLPALTLALAAGCWLAAWYEVAPGITYPLVMAAPEQQICDLLAGMNSGALATPARHFGLQPPAVDILSLGQQLQQRYGGMVLNKAEVHAWSPEQATVWSWTTTDRGETYLLAWTLAPSGSRWAVVDLTTMRNMERNERTEE